MKVMILLRSNDETEAGVLPTEKELADMGAYNEKLAEAGILRDGEGLKPSSEGARVTFTDGQKIVTDGPFAETKELIAGYWVWDVDSMEQAIEWVKKCPVQDTMLEIRPMYEADDFGEAFTPELRAQEDRLRAQIQRDA